MATAVVTLAIGTAPEFAMSHPLFERYARRIDAKFIRISECRIRHRHWFSKAKHGVMYEKYQIGEILQDFDRVIYLDGDVLIHPLCPDLTGIVPEECLGAVLEDCGSLWWKRWDALFSYQRRFGYLPEKPTGYFNGGVMVFSRKHAPLFDLKTCPSLNVRWAEQSALNYHANRLRLPVMDMGWRYNCMGCFDAFASDDLRLNEARVIHYAGEWRSWMRKDYRQFFADPGDLA